jgi:hypothetical protein
MRQTGRQAARIVLASLALAAMMAPAPASAQTVTAADPPSVVQALRSGGYGATLTQDAGGDPMIDLQLGTWKATLVFYECLAATHDQCQSVQFRATFDAEGAGMSPADALRFVGQYRFVSVTLNVSNDPILSWDVVTGSGVPGDVFLLGARRYLDALNAMGRQLYG